MRSLILGLLLAAAGCAPPPGSGMETSADTTVREGVVKVVGSAPVNVQVVLAPEAGESVYLRGPLVEEIRNAAGARVRVTGRLEGGALVASDYRVTAVDGTPVEMGVVERGADGSLQLRTPDGEVVHLIGATEQFRVGQKVWVQGPNTATVRVQSFGVLSS